MLIGVGYELGYLCVQPTPMLLVLNVHDSRVSDIVEPDHLTTSPPVPVGAYRDMFGNRCSRITAPAGRIVISGRGVVRDSGRPDPADWNARQHPVEELPSDALMFLLSSRFCETERLADYAWATFGHTPLGWPRVQAVCDFVHDRIRFGYEHARPTKTAFDVFVERQGVCRDYAHLAITLCRCLNIPARYCTGYLGDIGVPPLSGPMDFASWFEAYLGGEWHAFDPRHNRPRIGRVLIARGRDATDVAISTTFGPNTLERFRVWTHEIVDSPGPPAI